MRKPKKIKPGHHYYMKAGMKPVIVYIKPGTHRKLSAMAKRQAKTMQDVLREALEQRANSQKTRR